MNNITEFLNKKGFHCFEGHSQQVPPQIEDIIKLISDKPNMVILEIGFNAGHSSEIFLENNKTCSVISFDLGYHDYVSMAKEFIDIKYPRRHTLVLGDSKVTIPKFIEHNPNFKCDLVFIDGNHEYEWAISDITNCLDFAHSETIVIMDDTAYSSSLIQRHTIGPTKAWLEMVENKKVIEICRREYYIGRGMSWGKYVV